MPGATEYSGDLSGAGRNTATDHSMFGSLTHQEPGMNGAGLFC